MKLRSPSLNHQTSLIFFDMTYYRFTVDEVGKERKQENDF